MPKESLSVYLTAVDGISPVFASITDKTKALDKESQELQRTYEALQKANKGLIEQKVNLGKELKEVNEAVKEAKKNFEELKDEASEDAYKKALENQQKLRSEIAATNKSLQENQKIYKENIEITRKNALGGEGQDGGLSGLSGLGAIVAGLGAWDQVSSLVQSGAGKFLESSLGSGLGGIASGALSSAISGAVLGSTIMPGAGTAIGALAGGAVGALGGALQEAGNKDDAFRDYYGGLYSDVKGRSGETVEAGTSLASARETNRISLTTLFDGDEGRARSYLEDLIDMANSTPFLYDDLVSMSKTLATYGYDDSNILPLLQTVGDAGAALGMGASDMNSIAQALGRMKSSDKTTREYLDILNDRGIGAVGMLADAYGVSQGDMYGMISKGQISGAEAVEIITAAMEKSYAGAMRDQSQTFAGLSSTLEGLEKNLNALGGEGYNTLRQVGVEAQVSALDGALGDAIGEINAVMGENQARRENLQDQYIREAMAAVLLGERGKVFSEDENAALAELSAEYAEMKERYESSAEGDAEAGARMEALFETAQSLGQAYFDNSSFVQMLNDTELDEIQAILDNTAALDNATQASYRLSQALSRGLGSGLVRSLWGDEMAEGAGGDTSSLTTVGGHVGMAEEKSDGYYTYSGLWVPYSHAFGLDRVPYNEYPALLHADERVLTAAEARAQDAGRGSGQATGPITITGNNFIGTPEELADQIAEILLRKLTQEATAAAPK